MRYILVLCLLALPLAGQFTTQKGPMALAINQPAVTPGEADFLLGADYYLGQGVPQNYTEAAKWFRKAAEQGHAEAQDALGDMYFLGDGVSQNFVEGVKWYRQAAVQGNASAQASLGISYQSGKGVPRNYTEAMNWFWRAALQGHAKAQLFIGSNYAQGQGVPQNNAEAYVWLSISAANQNPQAPEMRDIVAKRLTPQSLEAAQTRAQKLFEEIQARKGKP